MWETLASGLLGSVFNNLFTDESLWNEFGLKTQSQVNWERQQDINKENWNRQQILNQQNIDNAWQMWNASNEYNTPSAQMQRFKDAGLNPNLIYGQTNMSSPVSIPSQSNTESKSYSTNKSPFEDFSKMVMNIPQVREQYKILKEKRRQEEIKTQTDALNLEYLNLDHTRRTLDNMKYGRMLGSYDYLNSWFDAEIENTKSPKLKNELIKSQKAFNSINYDFTKAKLKYFDSFPDSKGIWELQRDLLNTRNSLLDIDLDFEEAMKFTGVANPWIKNLLNVLKLILK